MSIRDVSKDNISGAFIHSQVMDLCLSHANESLSMEACYMNYTIIKLGNLFPQLNRILASFIVQTKHFLTRKIK